MRVGVELFFLFLTDKKPKGHKYRRTEKQQVHSYISTSKLGDNPLLGSPIFELNKKQLQN